MNRSTLPISMKKVDMIEEYELLYRSYNNLKQTIDIQSTYIEILMDMLLKQGVSQEEINEKLDGNKMACRIEILRKEKINNNILVEQSKVKDYDIKLLKNRIKKLESRERPKKVLEVSKDEFELTGYKYCCPNCGMLVGTITEDRGLDRDDYCCSCGQKLNWSEKDEEDNRQ